MTARENLSPDGEDEAALLARLASVARGPYTEVVLGFHEPAGHRLRR